MQHVASEVADTAQAPESLNAAGFHEKALVSGLEEGIASDIIRPPEVTEVSSAKGALITGTVTWRPVHNDRSRNERVVAGVR